MKKLMAGVAIAVLGLASIGCGPSAGTPKPTETKATPETKAEPAPTTTPDAGAPEKKE